MHDDNTTDNAAPSRNGKARRHVDQGIDIAPIGRVPAERKRQRDAPKIKDAVTVDEYIAPPARRRAAT